MSEMEWIKTFGDNLRYYLSQYGMTQGELADRTGLDQSTISRYVNGTVAPGIRAIVNIANALGVTTDELIDFGDTIDM